MVRSESGPKLLWPVALTLCLPNTPYQFWPHLHSMTIYRGQFWSIIGVPAWLYCGAYTFSNRFPKPFICHSLLRGITHYGPRLTVPWCWLASASNFYGRSAQI